MILYSEKNKNIAKEVYFNIVLDMETIKVFTAFSGYDSQMMALNRVAERHKGDIDFDLIGW